uniref:Uncharacterized protein n=1 Tax=Zonotrichia albicollis TaxID=44394 RepID=A0A8D2NKI0_ZONAL
TSCIFTHTTLDLVNNLKALGSDLAVCAGRARVEAEEPPCLRGHLAAEGIDHLTIGALIRVSSIQINQQGAGRPLGKCGTVVIGIENTDMHGGCA